MAEALTAIEVAKTKLLALETALLDRDPQLPHRLKDVHDYLKATPECVTLFTSEPEMSAVLIKALERQTNTELVDAKAKKPASATSKKALSKATVDDLGF